MSDLSWPFSEVRSVWMNGELIPFAEAKVSVLTHALHYGSGVFEGIRCYETPEGSAVFRLREHMERLVASAKVFRMELDWDVDALCRATLETLRANGLGRAYIRPLVFRGFGPHMGILPLKHPVEAVIVAWPTRGMWLSPEAAEKGIEVCVTSWRRPSADVLPTNAKATANYITSQLVTMEAHLAGYNEGISLDANGHVGEGAAENLFLVENGRLWTPPSASSILAGITRETVVTLARDEGLEVGEKVIPRGLLYTADELFLTGTSAEITPIASVDRIPVGPGKPGPITRRLWDRLQAIAGGQEEDRWGWLTPVEVVEEAAVGAS